MVVQRTDDHALPPSFWFKPFSTFGLSDITTPLDVHMCWSYPLIPCSSPPSCWQIPPCLAAWRTGYSPFDLHQHGPHQPKGAVTARATSASRRVCRLTGAILSLRL